MLENGVPAIHSPEEYIESSLVDENMENIHLAENPTTLLEDNIKINETQETEEIHDTRKKRLCKDKKKYV